MNPWLNGLIWGRPCLILAKVHNFGWVYNRPLFYMRVMFPKPHSCSGGGRSGGSNSTSAMIAVVAVQWQWQQWWCILSIKSRVHRICWFEYWTVVSVSVVTFLVTALQRDHQFRKEDRVLRWRPYSLGAKPLYMSQSFGFWHLSWVLTLSLGCCIVALLNIFLPLDVMLFALARIWTQVSLRWKFYKQTSTWQQRAPGKYTMHIRDIHG